ncbi:type IV pilus secretin PilQ [Anaeromyxobacter terrae]|uniref:type IV pilus secretin PilQ n=1 Tax=Anaeromyxobacter terrae TaxID=2925406 RepID=UPI001F599A78|nr:type IV pilus secretin family protein [Anaeromyxobacter sp. SG22]
MKIHLLRLAVVLSGALAVPALAAEPNAIRALDVAERDGAIEVAIQGNRPPSYTVFKLQDPPRLVVDLAGADVSKLASPVAVKKGGVAEITTAQYQDDRNAVGRVIVALDAARPYEVTPRGDAVVVRVLAEGAKPSSPGGSTEAGHPERSASAPAEARSRGTPTATPTVTAATAATATATATQGADDHVVSRRVDEGGAGSARTLRAVRPGKDGLTLATDGELGRIEILELRDPARLVLDLHGVTRAPKGAVKLAGAFTQVRFGKDDGKIRAVLDAAGELPKYEVKRVAGGLAIVAGTDGQVAKATPIGSPEAGHPERSRGTPTPTAAASPTAAVTAKKAPATRAQISDVRFGQQGKAARIEIGGKARYTLSRPDPRTIVLSLEDAEIPKKLERSLDTSAFQGPVLMVSSFNQPSTGQVKIVATLRGAAKDELVETKGGLAWTFSSAEKDAPAASPAPVPEVRASEAQAAGFAAEAPAYALSGAPQARGYTGRRITLDFHDIDIRNLLRLIADVSKKNIVVADDVNGKVTVSLRNVPWDQALDLVLKAKGLGKEEMGNVIRIARFDEIAKEQLARAEAEKARIPLMPLKVRIIPVNFARAGDVSGRVKDVLTERGSVSTDERTNVLIVKDVQEALVRAEGLVRNLDTEIPQVLIESRIVEASSNFNKALGVQWGGNTSFTQVTGNPTGLAFPNNVAAAGGAGPGNSFGTAANPNYAVSLPAPVGDGQGGALGLVFGSAGGAFNLNLRLSALENNGVVKTISAPKIATIDNKEATIGQGISIPFSQVSASGVNTTFIEAKLELKVTPHVSADGSILLKIKATNNQPNPQLTGANGQPSISKREAETEVLVKDGETTVIGGIYTRQTSNRTSEVPFLGKLPLLGYFFRNTSEQDDHTELLIFITPRILNRATAVAAGN